MSFFIEIPRKSMDNQASCINKYLQAFVKILLSFMLLFTMFHLKSQGQNLKEFDLQGHRGARGLMPENTVPGMIESLKYGVKAIELDVVISKDNQVVISHEPWFSHKICTKPDGTPVSAMEEKLLNIYEMNYDEIKEYDCGSRGHPGFPEQKPMRVSKPLLIDAIIAVEDHIKREKLPPVIYNIEIKTKPGNDNKYHPKPKEFIALVYSDLKEHNILSRVLIQSFDVRALQELRKIDSTISTALLIANLKSIDKNIEKLGFTPDVFSPFHKLVGKKMAAKLHDRGIRLVPWTVNKAGKMEKLIRRGVDGLITDRPDIAAEVLRKLGK